MKRDGILAQVRHPLLLRHLQGVGTLYAEEDLEDDGVRRSIRVLVTGGMAPVRPATLDRLPSLELIALPAAGYSGIDLPDAARRGLFVTNVRAVNHEDVADAALGMMIVLARGLLHGAKLLREGRWTPGAVRPTRSLRARQVGIVGLGCIGEAIARRVEALGCAVAWWGPNAKPGSRYRRVPDGVG